MSYGRRNGLPGQTGGRDDKGYQGHSERGESAFPGQAPEGRQQRRVPGGKSGGGGIMMLLIIGAVMFFMMRGGMGGPGYQGQPKNGVDQQQPGGDIGQPWRPGEDRRTAENDTNRNDPNRVQIPGLDPDSGKKSDKVENKDGWSMEDANQDDDKNRVPLSNQKQSPKSDKVKTKDGWEMMDAKQKDKGNG